MTLNVTIATPSLAAQASDRRISLGGQPVTDEANKAVVIKAVDGDVTITFAGLAALDGMPVDHWLLEQLYDRKSPAQGIQACVEAVREAATASFLQMQRRGTVHHHTFVVAGWSLYWKANAMIWVVSNCEDENLRMTDATYDEFVVREVKTTPSCVLITGMEPAVDPDSLPRLVSRIERPASTEQILDAMVSEIRLAKRHPVHGDSIGETCMTVAIDPDGQTTALYYPTHGRPIRYAPNLIYTYRRKRGDPGMVKIGGVSISGGGPDFALGDGRRGGLMVRDRRRRR